MSKTLGLFEAFGIEIEYMIIDRDSKRTAALADKILVEEDGTQTDEITLGSIGVSNELAAHVLEFKSAIPTSDLQKLEADFTQAIKEVNRRLAVHNAVLAPSGAHPFMDPKTESVLWPYGNKEIYDTYHRIFDCNRHGWLNLQSCHLNLPFANEEEFAKLHAAIILLLPYLPALSASSPYLDSKRGEYLDTRLKVYAGNQARVPEIAGFIVPEPVFTFQDYQTEILQKTYDAIAPLDPNGILQYEWLNSRGAIARFDRNAIEIRVLDNQECPGNDIAICSLIIAILEALCELPRERLIDLAKSVSPAERKEQFLSIAKTGPDAPLQLADLASLFPATATAKTAKELWQGLLSQVASDPRILPFRNRIDFIVNNGNLAQRLVAKLPTEPSTKDFERALSDLAYSLDTNKSYR